MLALNVVTPFAAHNTGDRITDEAAIAAILACDQARFVVRVNIADEPAAEPAAVHFPAAEEHPASA